MRLTHRPTESCSSRDVHVSAAGSFDELPSPPPVRLRVGMMMAPGERLVMFGGEAEPPPKKVHKGAKVTKIWLGTPSVRLWERCIDLLA